MTKAPRLYMSAGLFNAESTFYNAHLTQKLEECGYECYLPQRDGAEVANLGVLLAQDKDISPAEANRMASYVPYYRDLGLGLAEASAVVAVLDDPIDEGLVVELSYARFWGIPVIGIRSDIRSPFGKPEDLWNINPFPVFQCDVFIKDSTPVGSHAQVISGVDRLIGKLESLLPDLIASKSSREGLSGPIAKALVHGARLMFEGIEDIHSDEGLKEIVKRIRTHMAFFDGLAPLNVGVK